MNRPAYAKALRTANALSILDQETGRLVPFRLNDEQQAVLRSLCASSRIVVLKGRQVGCSTVVAFFLLLVAIMNPGLPCCIVADDHAKAKAILARVNGWAKQLGADRPSVDTKESITLENGAVIDALTANSAADDGESKTGRSRSYGFIHATEMAFWRHARAVWAALTSTMLANAVVAVESTGVPGDGLFRAIFDDADKDGWKALFLGTEQHQTYRAAPTIITDETWETLRDAYGFTRRDSAAWWWTKLWRDFKGDVPRMLREYPIRPEHSFTFREGLHITGFTEVPVTEAGDWNYYVAPDAIDEPVILGVDTSEGIGLDASAIAVVGHRTGRVLATWKSNEMAITTFIAFVRSQIARFKPAATVIEKNGVGAVVHQALESVPGVIGHTSGSPRGEVKQRRDDLRDAIVTGAVPIGGHLVAEAKSSTVKAKAREDGTVRVVFVGTDDALSAVSFARKHRELNPWRAPAPAQLDPRAYVDRSTYRERKRRTGLF